MYQTPFFCPSLSSPTQKVRNFSPRYSWTRRSWVSPSTPLWRQISSPVWSRMMPPGSRTTRPLGAKMMFSSLQRASRQGELEAWGAVVEGAVPAHRHDAVPAQVVPAGAGGELETAQRGNDHVEEQVDEQQAPGRCGRSARRGSAVGRRSTGARWPRSTRGCSPRSRSIASSASWTACSTSSSRISQVAAVSVLSWVCARARLAVAERGFVSEDSNGSQCGRTRNDVGTTGGW